MEKIYGILKKYGFSESEIKVYTTLLSYGPLNGYEASKKSSVARSKVYGILANLENKGIVLSASGEKSTTYKAERPEKIIALLKEGVHNDCDLLEDLFKKYEEPVDDEAIWNITESGTVMYKLKELIKSAQKDIYLQIWQKELNDEIEKLLLKRESEGINVKMVLYDSDKKYTSKLKYVYKHGFEEEKINELSRRWINIVVDNDTMLYGSKKNNIDVSGIYTKNKSMVFFANEYIRHDIYCLKMIEIVEEIDMGNEKIKNIRDI